MSWRSLILLALGLVAAAGAAAGARPLAEGNCPELRDVGGVDYTVFDAAAALADSSPARYPELAIMADLGGEVAVEVAVAPDGTPVCVRILAGVHPVLDAAAVAAALDSRYRPALRNGQPAPGTAAVIYRFPAEPVVSDPLPAPGALAPAGSVPMVGDLAGCDWTGDDGGRLYRLPGGPEIDGNVPLAVVEAILAAVEPRMGAQEVVSSIWLPVADGSPTCAGLLAPGSIRVCTCARRSTGGDCTSATMYVVVHRKGVFEVLLQVQTAH